ncbi:MAG TPA: ABC transporter permease [Candidatus Paceibacterota bacterium]
MWGRIEGILIRNLYLYKRSIPRILDVFFWPSLDLILWGFLSLYLQEFDMSGLNIVTILLGAIIFWELLSQSQRAISITFLEEVWERNFLNIFVTPISMNEFLGATALVGLVRIGLVSILMSILAFLLYHFNFFIFGFLLIPFVINLLISGWVLGIFVIGLILRYGTSAQVLAFGLIAIIQPFTAVFYPVSALPEWAQVIAHAIPTTYVFEGMRAVLTNGNIPPMDLVLAFVLNILYLGLVFLFFRAMFGKVKKMGRLLKLD